MINWNRLTFDQISQKWDLFIKTRKRFTNGTPKKDKTHITCLERESLIRNLISRLERAELNIDDLKKFKEEIGKVYAQKN
jgi:hypothetical protein